MCVCVFFFFRLDNLVATFNHSQQSNNDLHMCGNPSALSALTLLTELKAYHVRLLPM